MTRDSPRPLPLTLCWSGRSLRRRRLPGNLLSGLPAPRSPERFRQVATPLRARPGPPPPKASGPLRVVVVVVAISFGVGNGSTKRPGEGLFPFRLAPGEPLADSWPLSARTYPARIA